MGKLLRAARAFMTNPVEAALYVPERISVRHDYPASYQPDPDREVRLHGWLGAAWPCPERGIVDTLLHDIAADLRRQALRRQTYGLTRPTPLKCSRLCIFRQGNDDYEKA